MPSDIPILDLDYMWTLSKIILRISSPYFTWFWSCFEGLLYKKLWMNSRILNWFLLNISQQILHFKDGPLLCGLEIILIFEFAHNFSQFLGGYFFRLKSNSSSEVFAIQLIIKTTPFDMFCQNGIEFWTIPNIIFFFFSSQKLVFVLQNLRFLLLQLTTIYLIHEKLNLNHNCWIFWKNVDTIDEDDALKILKRFWLNTEKYLQIDGTKLAAMILLSKYLTDDDGTNGAVFLMKFYIKYVLFG